MQRRPEQPPCRGWVTAADGVANGPARPLAPPACVCRRAPRLREPGVSWWQREQRARRRPEGSTGEGEREGSGAQTWPSGETASSRQLPGRRRQPKATSGRPTWEPGLGAGGAWPAPSVLSGFPVAVPWWTLLDASPPGSALPDGGRMSPLSSVPPASDRGSRTFLWGGSGLRVQAEESGPHLETEESNETFLNERMVWRTLF